MRQFFLCTVFSFSFCAFSQEQREYKTKVIDFNFLFYLFENQQFDDATFYSEQLFSNEDLSVNQKDSLAYLLGILSLEIKMHENASSAFEKISEQSPFYVPALFYSFYAHTQKKQYQEAREILNKIPQETPQPPQKHHTQPTNNHNSLEQQHPHQHQKPTQPNPKQSPRQRAGAFGARGPAPDHRGPVPM